MLKIIIENATFTCHEAGQVIDVALVKAEEWLHEGSICPSCTVGSLTFFKVFFFVNLTVFYMISHNHEPTNIQFSIMIFSSEMQKKTF